jgi:hypothetical protein
VFPGAFVLSMRDFVIDWYPHGLRYLICTEYYYGKKCCLFTLWRSGREYLSACFALWYILGRDGKKGGRTVVVVVGSVWVCSLSLFEVHTQRHANEAIEEAMHFCETGQQ